MSQFWKLLALEPTDLKPKNSLPGAGTIRCWETSGFLGSELSTEIRWYDLQTEFFWVDFATSNTYCLYVFGWVSIFSSTPFWTKCWWFRLCASQTWRLLSTAQPAICKDCGDPPLQLPTLVVGAPIGQGFVGSVVCCLFPYLARVRHAWDLAMRIHSEGHWDWSASTPGAVEQSLARKWCEAEKPSNKACRCLHSA